MITSILTNDAAGKPPPKDDKGLKKWIRNKLKSLASLPGGLGMKAAEAFPGIIGAIPSWILNKAADLVVWVSQNLWVLVVGIGGLLYTYMETTFSLSSTTRLLQLRSC